MSNIEMLLIFPITVSIENLHHLHAAQWKMGSELNFYGIVVHIMNPICINYLNLELIIGANQDD